MRKDARERARRHLDRRLSGLDRGDRLATPPKGWLRAIRNALGMSGGQLARRMGVRAQTIDAMEKSEAAGTIRLETLRRAAEALDCTLVYAIVPKTSLDDTVRTRARKIALRNLQRVAHTMMLEGQGTGEAGADERIEDYVHNVLKDRDLWNEP